MVKYTFLLTNKQHRFLKELGGNTSEIIRRAIDEYIERQKNLNVSISKSRKEGDKNG